ELQDGLWQRILPQLDPSSVIPSAPPAPPPLSPPAVPPPTPAMPTGLEGSMWWGQPALLAKVGLLATSTVASVALLTTVILHTIAAEPTADLRDPDDTHGVSHVIDQPLVAALPPEPIILIASINEEPAADVQAASTEETSDDGAATAAEPVGSAVVP